MQCAGYVYDKIKISVLLIISNGRSSHQIYQLLQMLDVGSPCNGRQPTISMTYYFSQVRKVMNDCYSNKGQLDTVIETRHYIYNHFDKKLNLDFLSRVSFTSKFHLLRLFKKYYGQTPKQYLIDIRIEQAKVLLKKGASITDTCFDVGFDNLSSFSTLFKRRVGLTATEFQKRATFTKQE